MAAEEDSRCILSQELSPQSVTRTIVSVVMPVHNAAMYLDQALQSVVEQTYRPIELSIYDDCSTDTSRAVVERWRVRLESAGIRLVVTTAADWAEAEGSTKAQVVEDSLSVIQDVPSGMDVDNDNIIESPGPLGIGCARNRAVRASHGEYLCHLDADDFMLPRRVELQLEAARKRPRTLVGSRFTRTPQDSTPYYTRWINGLSDERLVLEQYRECTIICPTWFYRRACFDAVGGYVEERDNPEDLTFFNAHLDIGGRLHKVDEELVVYRYVPGSFSARTDKRALQRARLPFLERRVLWGWARFTIWGAGKDGRRFLRDLSEGLAERVEAFCDVSARLVGRTYRFGARDVPIVHFSEARPPLVICVGTKNFGGAVEANIATLGLVEGRDFFHFA